MITLFKKITFLALITITVSLVHPVVAGQWPCFHGADRTNKSSETGLMKIWPKEGPKLLWTASGLGEGYSTVSIVDGRIYTAGSFGKQTAIFALDNSGKLLWKTANGNSWETNKPWARAYTGSRSTPTISNGILYHLGENGRLAAFDASNGKEKWNLDLTDNFQAEIPEYGYSESVLVDGKRLYCCPAGKKAFVACLDAGDGKVIWSTNTIPGTAGFNSPVLVDLCGYRQFVSLSSVAIFGIDAANGFLLWNAPIKNERENNIADPIVAKDRVFASSGYGRGSMLLNISKNGNKLGATTVWDTVLMDNHHGGVILHNGYLYGSGDKSKGWFCLDFSTGAPQWNSKGKGALTFADGMLYCLEEKGLMKLVKASPAAYGETGSFKVPSGGKGSYWAHPVVCDGRLYIRHADKLFAYDIHAR